MDQYKLFKGVWLTKEDTIKFKTVTAQNNFFNSKLFKTVAGREKVITDSIRVTEVDYYDLLDVTYVATNKVVGGKNKTYYYFVKDVEYVNDNLTKLNIELDVLQTYMFDYEIVNSNVIREHQDRYDSNGNRIWNKEKEPITVNEFTYLEEYLRADGRDGSENIFYIISTSRPEGTIETAELTKYGNLHSYLESSVSAFHYDRESKVMTNVYYERHYGSGSGNSEEVKMANLEVMSKVSYKPELVDIVIVPYLPGFEYYTKNGKHFIKNDSIPIGAQNSVVSWRSYAESAGGGGATIMIKDLDIPNGAYKLPTHVGINNFLLGAVGELTGGLYDEGKIFSPQFMEASIVTDINNAVNFYLDELTIDGLEGLNYTFDYNFGNSVEKTYSIGPRGYQIPNNILVNNVKDSLVLITDEYLNSLKFEAHSRSAAKLNGVINAVTGIGISAISGGALAPLTIGKVTGLATQQINERAKLDDLRSRPVKLGSELDNVDFNLTKGFIAPRVTLKLPTTREMNRIVKWFKDYGYAANRTGIPNLDNRKVFNYVETSDMVLKGKIGTSTIGELQRIYNQGVRFWHSPSTFLNFNIQNGEV